QASLIVAASDLKVVRLLRDAIRAADLSGGKAGAPRTAVSPPEHFHTRQQQGIEPRPVVHPTPRFLPRPVFHPHPRLEATPSATPPEKPDQHDLHRLPICPKAFWDLPVPPTPKIQVHLLRPNVIHKGSLIDFFM